MDWNGLLAVLGLAGADAVRAESMVPAAIVILLAGLAAWAVERIASRRLGDWLARHGTHAGLIAERIGALLRWGTAALVLLFGAALLPPEPLGRIGMAAALAIAFGFFAFNVTRAGRLGRGLAFVVAIVVAVAAGAGELGGLSGLARTLDSAAIAIGERRVSVLTLFQGLLAIAALAAVARLAGRVASVAILNADGLDAAQRVLADKLASIAIIVVAFFIGIDLLGIDLTALAVFSGALGLAVGFGLQKTFGNLIAGIILLMDRSVKPGDVIVVGDQFGWVEKIGVRAVSVLTRDGKEHLIPNETLMTERVENWSYSSRTVRIRIPVGVAYDCDIDLAQKLMLEAAAASPRVLKSPRPTVWMKGFGDSSVDHDILAWIEDPEEGVGNVQSDILNRLFRSFRDHGIEIPFPQRDLRLRTVPECFGAQGGRHGGGDAA